MDLPFEQTPHAGLDPTSFSDVLRNVRPESLPKVGSVDGLAMPHATTILAVVFEDGVIIAGDRRAIEGFTIADRTIEKVFATDDMSAVAIAGTAGPAIEMTRLFQTELEHYEKVEGERLTLDGKANKLAQLIRAHLPLAMQGLGVVPLFAGFDESKKVGRIFKYDMTGGRYEQTDYATTGSGGKDAKATIKKRYRPDLPRDEAIKVALEGLFDASEEDVATGGPDVLRRIYPNIASITAAGFKEIPDDEIAQIFDDLLAERQGTVYPHTSIPEASEGGTDN
jgi:proteasome beta subunit